MAHTAPYDSSVSRVSRTGAEVEPACAGLSKSGAGSRGQEMHKCQDAGGETDFQQAVKH